MVVYNVTVSIDDDVHEDWLQWMKSKHIPDVMKTGYFEDCRMLKLLNEMPNSEGTTYAIQYTSKSMETIEEYQKNAASALQKEHTERYSGKFGAFRTYLQVEEVF